MSIFTLSGRNILIVDDLHAMRTIVRSLLNPFQPRAIIEAGDGAEALDIIKARRIDLVITDLNMAPMSGVALTREIRRPDRSANSQIPVLIITGHRESTHVRAALEAGVNEFLTKPLVPSEFKARLENIFNKPRPQVRSATYQGPDRRRRAMWVRDDRRGAVEL